MSGGKVVLVIIGIMLLLVASGLIISGGVILWANTYLTDDGGYYCTKTMKVEKDSYAIKISPFDINMGLAYILDRGHLATLKVEGFSNDPSKDIFIGITEDAHLEKYFNNVKYEEVSNITIYPGRLEYINHPGDSVPDMPIIQTFWSEFIHGKGMQILVWDNEPGAWSLVIMNTDGSPNINVIISLGVQIPWFPTAGIWLLAGGFVVLIIGSMLILLAVRNERGGDQ